MGAASNTCFFEKVIVRPVEKIDIFTDTANFMIKFCVHGTHKTPRKSPLIVGFTTSIGCNWGDSPTALNAIGESKPQGKKRSPLD